MKTYNDMRDHNPDMVNREPREDYSREDWYRCRDCGTSHYKDDMHTVSPPNGLSIWLCDSCAVQHYKERCERLSTCLGSVYGLASCEISSGSIAWRRAAEEIKEVLHG